MIFIFLLVVKRFVKTKNSVVKIQNLAVNHESRPAKPNPVAVSRNCNIDRTKERKEE